jgi:hypothetical protein
MQCREFESVVAQDGFSLLPAEAQEHLAQCSACQDLLADLSSIVAAAREIPAAVNPPERIWVSLHAQLQAEGIIRETGHLEPVAAGAWWSGFSQYFQWRALATGAAVATLVVGSIYFAEHSTSPIVPAAPVRVVPPPQTASAMTPPQAQAVAEIPSPEQLPLRRQASSLHAARVSSASSAPRESTTDLAPSPTENAYFGDSAAVLKETEGALPSRALTNNAAVDAAMRQNLHTLNECIAECESRLRQHPQDQLTREYLNMAYQQKAELLTAMMDSGRSEH